MKTPSELYYEYGEKAQIPEYASEVFIITEYKFTKALEEYVAQQVSVEPVVKMQIAEMVERHIIAHEQMKEQYLGKNLEMYSKAGGAMLALEKLLKDLRKSNLSA